MPHASPPQIAATAEVDVDGDTIIVRDGGTIRQLPLSWRTLIRLTRVHPREGWTDHALHAVETLHADAVASAAMAAQEAASGGCDGLSPVQEQGVRWLTLPGGRVLADEMGSGKTVQACTALERLVHEGIRTALIVCPASVIVSWLRHLEEWAPSWTSWRCDVPAARRADLVKQWSTHPGRGALIVSWDTLRRVDLGDAHIDVAVFDEAHRAKNPKTKRTRAAHRISASRRWCLTGTPVGNAPLDLWGVLRLADPAGWPSRDAFAAEYCHEVSVGADGHTIHVWGSAAQRAALRSEMLPSWRRMSMQQAIGRDIERVRLRRMNPMSPRQRAQYVRLRSAWVLEEGEQRKWVPDAVTRLLRLAQVAAGVMQEQGDRWTMTDSSKVAELRAAMEELDGEQIVVFSPWLGLVDLTVRMLASDGVESVRITGDVSASERARRIAAFQSGEAAVCVASTQAAGEGIDLSAARTVVHMAPSWSAAQMSQAEDRVRRWTQQSSAVRVIELCSAGTVEEQIWAAAERKTRLVDAVSPAELAASL